jgi:hypothetical protein
MHFQELVQCLLDELYMNLSISQVSPGYPTIPIMSDRIVAWFNPRLLVHSGASPLQVDSMYAMICARGDSARGHMKHIFIDDFNVS